MSFDRQPQQWNPERYDPGEHARRANWQQQQQMHVQQQFPPHVQYPQQQQYGQVQPYAPPQPYQQPYPRQWQQPYPQPMAVAPKSPGVALLLGLLIPGLGCMTSGRAGLGVLILACWIVSAVLAFVFIGWLLAPACWIWSGVAGYMSAQAWNREHGIIS